MVYLYKFKIASHVNEFEYIKPNYILVTWKFSLFLAFIFQFNHLLSTKSITSFLKFFQMN